jgi:hypothetical protein
LVAIAPNEKTLSSAAGNELLSRASWDIGFFIASSRAKISIGKPERPDQNNHEKREHKSKPHSEKFGEQEHYSVESQRLASCEK